MRMTKQLINLEITDHARPLTSPLLVLLVAFFSVFASSVSISGESNWGEVTLEAGKSGTCISSPCKVYLVMPPGKGNYDVMADGMKVGSFPAGQTVALGSFWTGFTTFTIVGSDVGPTRLNVVGRQ